MSSRRNASIQEINAYEGVKYIHASAPTRSLLTYVVAGQDSLPRLQAVSYHHRFKSNRLLVHSLVLDISLSYRVWNLVIQKPFGPIVNIARIAFYITVD